MDKVQRRNRSIAAQFWLLQLLVTAFACFQMFMSQMSVASCSGTRCDYGLLSTAVNVCTVGAVVLLAGAALAIIILERLQRSFIWPPTVGLVVMIALFATTYAFGRGALDLPSATERI